MTVQVLQQIYENSPYYKRTIEAKWVQRLNTLKPLSANVKGEQRKQTASFSNHKLNYDII